MQNLVSYVKGGIQNESDREEGAEETSGPKTDEVTGGWRKLHNEELRKSYSPPSKDRMAKSRRLRWAEHVARMVEKRLRVGY
jgi:hypothetical protein